MESKWFTIVVLGGLLIVIVVCLVFIGYSSPTENEAVLLSIVLTVFSLVGSWIASRHFAEYSFNRNQKLFALKAAEKVNNLSNELNRLSIFLGSSLDDEGTENMSEALLARGIRIESAIHMLHTLKSSNDASLSDWQGVIGEELESQREERAEREEELKELVERIENIHSSLAQEGEDKENIYSELSELRKALWVVTSQIGRVSVGGRKKKPPPIDIEESCPSCSETVRYKQRMKPNSHKSLKCKECGALLYSRYIDEKFILSIREHISETINCPSCNKNINVDIDPMPGSSLVIECEFCSAKLRVFRTIKDVGAREVLTSKPSEGEKAALDEDIIEQIKTKLPPQPWEKGVHKVIALEMGLTMRHVLKAIQELIRRGDFKPQKDGVICVTEDQAEVGAAEG